MSQNASLPDDALLALGRLLRAAVGSSWLALTPTRDEMAGPRLTADLSATPPGIHVEPATPLKLMPADGAGRVWQLPADRRTLPPIAFPNRRTYFACALRSADGLVGLLELAWDEPRADVNERELNAHRSAELKQLGGNITQKQPAKEGPGCHR